MLFFVFLLLSLNSYFVALNKQKRCVCVFKCRLTCQVASFEALRPHEKNKNMDDRTPSWSAVPLVRLVAQKRYPSNCVVSYVFRVTSEECVRLSACQNVTCTEPAPLSAVTPCTCRAHLPKLMAQRDYFHRRPVQRGKTGGHEAPDFSTEVRGTDATASTYHSQSETVAIGDGGGHFLTRTGSTASAAGSLTLPAAAARPDRKFSHSVLMKTVSIFRRGARRMCTGKLWDM